MHMRNILRACLPGLAAVFAGTAALAAPIPLTDPGTEKIILYERYGTFHGVDTESYRFEITDSAGLKKAAGEGIFPNVNAIFADPAYKKLKKEGALEGSHWEFVNSDDYPRNFYKWATASEEPGAKLYYIALALEKAGNIEQAIKAYYALVVHFPKSTGMTYWKTPWYMGPVAIDSIKYLTRRNPKLGIKLFGASIHIKNGLDADTRNDVFIVNPGRLERVKPEEVAAPDCDPRNFTVERTIGSGRVQLRQYSNRHWQLTVDGKPYTVRGIAYSPNKVGLSPDRGTLNVSRDWMFADYNKNGVIDGPYEAWVDKNRNEKQDPGEKPVGDFKLMKDMGVNTLRLYHHDDFNRQLLREGYEKYGFMYLMGDFIGMYAVGSKADWWSGTDYTNPEHQKNMLESVRKMVETYRDEPYILMWVLGNETNYGAPGEKGKDSGSGTRAKLQPEAYYRFVNEAAKLIKSLDPQGRPVAVCNGDTLFLDICAANAPDVDIFGANSYRGEHGFGTLWRDVSEVYDRPVIITEYGCTAYHPAWSTARIEQGQAQYLMGNWSDIEGNLAGSGTGNALGGILFEWLDEWWKANSDLPLDVQQKNPKWYAARSAQYKDLQPDKHDSVPQSDMPFLDGWSYEEWCGVASQGDGRNSPFKRQLRLAYFEYQKPWKKYRDAR